jgi:hydrogenase expression/formation protein HypD
MATVAATISLLPQPASAATRPSGPLVPSSGTLMGAYVDPDGVWSGNSVQESEISTFESQIGRKLAIVQHYYSWTNTFPSGLEQWDIAGGRTPLVSWSGTSLDAINSGSYDAMIRARAEGLKNFSVFCNHVTIVPAIKAILDSPDLRLDGFIGPGHVSTVIGCRPYEFIAKQYGKPVVVAGFEPLDILQSIYMLMLQLSQGRSEVENQYARVVPWNGNLVALKAIGETMELRPYFEWRGLGFISHSALKVHEKYAAMDAELLFQVPGVRVADPKACQCGEVLKGVLKPWECKVFGTACTPETPIGTCMVSPEGACAAYYNFGRFAREREVV